MANPLAIALALYGGYKGYKAGKERGGGLGGIIGGALGAAGGYYGGQYLGQQMGLSNIGASQGSALTSGKIAAGGTQAGAAGLTGPAELGMTTRAAAPATGGNIFQRALGGFKGMSTGQ